MDKVYYGVATSLVDGRELFRIDLTEEINSIERIEREEKEMKTPLYCFAFNRYTNTIKKHVIEEIFDTGWVSRYRYHYVLDFGDGLKKHGLNEYYLDKVFDLKFYTYNPSFDNALNAFMEYFMTQKRKVSTDYDRIVETIEILDKKYSKDKKIDDTSIN